MNLLSTSAKAASVLGLATMRIIPLNPILREIDERSPRTRKDKYGVHSRANVISIFASIMLTTAPSSDTLQIRRP